MPTIAARVIYPELPDPLTPGDVQRLFSPSFTERDWAPTVARRPESQVALLVHLKIFQTIGRFVAAAQIPSVVVERVALKMGVDCANPMASTKRTLHRHRAAILHHLGEHEELWGAALRAILAR